MLDDLRDVCAMLHVLALWEGCAFDCISMNTKTAMFYAQEKQFGIKFTATSTCEELRNALIIGSFNAVTK
jgi:hypothetical protein